MPATLTGDKVYRCQECEMLFTQDEGGGRNGTMCPDCGNKFGTKETDSALKCPHCEEFIDLESWEALE
jgi:DNA-directed RNA polymerase subunit RPC12/RpoP